MDKKSNSTSSRIPFTWQESVNLVRGVEQYGKGAWADILSNFAFHSKRTSVNLKDRYRTMEKIAEKQNTSIYKAFDIPKK